MTNASRWRTGAADGRARATAGPGIQSTPLGALAHLLPPGLADVRCDLVAVLDAVAAELRRNTDTGPLVLFVDDLQWLDSTSAILLAQLVDADLVFLVATVRTGEPVPAPLAGLWQRGRVERVDLAPLDEAGIDSLLHLVLRGPVAPGTIAALWSASRGNVLFVRELVLGALDAGRLVDQHGVWQMTGALVTTAPLLGLVEARFGELDTDDREAVEMLAVWEPIGLSMLESMLDPRRLERLDRIGLLATRTDGRRHQVALAHPLYGEILRAHMSTLTRRRLLVEHAARIEHCGARRREDPIRVATARVDAGQAAPPELLIEAARLARWAHDFAQVERLARAAQLSGGTPEAALMLGEALHELGAYDEAETVFDRGTAGCGGRRSLLRVDRGDPGPQSDVGAAPPRRCARGESNRASALPRSRRGRRARPVGSDAPDVLRATGGRDGCARRGRSERSSARACAVRDRGSSLTGRDGRARGGGPSGSPRVRRARTAAAPDGDRGRRTARDQRDLRVDRCGRARVTRSYSRQAAYQVVPSNAPPAGPMWLTFLLGRAALLRGEVATARRWLGEAVARAEEYDYAGPRRLALSLLATAHALLGDAPAAAAAVAELDRAPELAYARAEQELGRAWALVAAAEVPAAREVLFAAAEIATTSGYRVTEAALLHDIARLGEAATVADRLEALAAQCDGALVGAYAAHARALAGVRPEPRVAAADRFEAFGALLLAAEAATEAADAFLRRGERRLASAASVRAARLAAACEGARTPALATTDFLRAAQHPGARDRGLRRRGETAKEIAARLFLSVRTVNNHLQSVYTKLGISGRSELARALGETGSITPDDQP